MSWFRDGQVISPSTLPGVQISFSDGRARLTIPAATKANSGRYSLRATNGSGQATSTAELLVTGRQGGPARPLKQAAQKASPGSGVGVVHQELVSAGSWNPEKGSPEAALTAKLFVLWNLIFRRKWLRTTSFMHISST